MPDAMTREERDELAKVAYAVTRRLPKKEALDFLRWFGCASDEEAKYLYRLGSHLARREKRRAA